MFTVRFALLASLTLPRLVDAQAAFSGQVSAWVASKPETSAVSETGLRYIPEFSLQRTLGDSLIATLDLSPSGVASGSYAPHQVSHFDAAAKAYRAWLRLATHTFEVRAGLQKLNFGSATLFRPLMWFDRVDPRDPLQLTDGVWGGLARYYLHNNTNFWAWVLYGNTRLKGWEVAPTEDGSVEYGGRVQTPLPAGELGITYHHRQADLRRFPTGTVVPENRFGLDGKWNLGVGVWGEAALVHEQTAIATLHYQRFWDLGADYTIGVGSGLYVLGEYARIATPSSPLGAGPGAALSGLTLNYPIGILDKVSAIVFRHWQLDQWYRIVSWQRTYDAWTFYLLGFWNPTALQGLLPQQQSPTFAGRGLELIAVFNH